MPSAGVDLTAPAPVRAQRPAATGTNGRNGHATHGGNGHFNAFHPRAGVAVAPKATPDLTFEDQS